MLTFLYLNMLCEVHLVNLWFNVFHDERKWVAEVHMNATYVFVWHQLLGIFSLLAGLVTLE